MTVIDNDIIAEIIPTTPMALQIVRQTPAHLRSSEPDSRVSGVMMDGTDKIQLRFSSPKKYAAAFLFGRSSVCDVSLELPGRECYANTIQWALSVAPDGQLSIVDVNYDGKGLCKTTVMYSRRYAASRSNFVWRLNGIPGPTKWTVEVVALDAYSINKDVPLDANIGFQVIANPNLFTPNCQARAAASFAAQDAWMPQINSNPQDNAYVWLGWLGQGASGVVSHMWNVSTGEHIAKKRFMITSASVVKRETQMLQRLCHDNVLKMMFYTDERWAKPYGQVGISPVLYLEYAPFGSLRGADIREPFSPEERVDAVRQCLSALVYMHDNNVMHRDIKPENILVFTRNPILVKIADFGISKYQSPDSHNSMGRGTHFYMAPEALTSSSYTLKVDVWSFGMTILAMMHGERSLRNKERDNRLGGVKSNRPYKSLATCPFTEYVAKRMLVVNTDERPSMRQCAEDLFPGGGSLAYRCCGSETGTTLDSETMESTICVDVDDKDRLVTRDPDTFDSQDEWMTWMTSQGYDDFSVNSNVEDRCTETILARCYANLRGVNQARRQAKKALLTRS